jgi:hypothetical protein
MKMMLKPVWAYYVAMGTTCILPQLYSSPFFVSAIVNRDPHDTELMKTSPEKIGEI